MSIPAEQVDVGMEIVVKPGELIPVDGTVTSSVSEADLTGEPVPVRKATGMLVLSGSVNLDGVLGVRASKRSAESKYAQIVHLVEEAQSSNAPIHRLADRYSVGFTLAALALAGLAWALSGDSVYARAVRLGRRVMRVALEGIWVGMGLSTIAMLFAAFGFITPAAGALLQEGIDVIVILNALRVGRISF